MGRLEIVHGDLLLLPATVDCIVQQCNCVSKTAKGLSLAIAQRYPYAAVYKKRAPLRSTPGTVVWAEPPSRADGPVVACLMAQVSIGRSGHYCSTYDVDPETDTRDRRLEYFRVCLQLLQARAMISLASPFRRASDAGLLGGIGRRTPR